MNAAAFAAVSKAKAWHQPYTLVFNFKPVYSFIKVKAIINFKNL